MSVRRETVARWSEVQANRGTATVALSLLSDSHSHTADMSLTRPLVNATRVGGRRFAVARAPTALVGATRSYAQVTDAAANPVKRHGGLQDKDRIFTNAYRQADHGLKGALVSTRASISAGTPSPSHLLATR